MTRCSHLDTIEITELPEEVAGCEDCLAAGGVWLHLRICLACGHVGCCDDSPNKHASAHASQRAPDHPLAGAGRGLVLVLRGRDRDADPAGHRVDADSALADAVALNSALGGGEHAALAVRRAGELHADRQAEVVEADRHRARRQAGDVLRDGEGQHAVAEGLRGVADRLG